MRLRLRTQTLEPKWLEPKWLRLFRLRTNEPQFGCTLAPERTRQRLLNGILEAQAVALLTSIRPAARQGIGEALFLGLASLSWHMDALQNLTESFWTL